MIVTTGQRIKQLRLAKGLSQEQLGGMVGVKKAAINKYESGLVVNIKRSTIAKLAEALDTDPVYLLGLTEQAPAPPEDERSHIQLIFDQLSPANQTKLLELADLYLASQNKTEETK